RRRTPVAESARNARSERRAEAHADLLVERVVLAEPDVARDPCPRLRRTLSRLRGRVWMRVRCCFVRDHFAGARNEPEIEGFGSERRQCDHADYHTAFCVYPPARNR